MKVGDLGPCGPPGSATYAEYLTFSLKKSGITTNFMYQTNAIHSVDTGLIYAVLKLSFSKQ